ncbi:MAG TPA: hypothetical protein PK413_05975, partial [Thermoanaerobaculia bacterium]|nr:hypothetical protein [Thermoanaerobaculia bacterium]
TFGEAPTGYSSPIAVNLGGVHQILTVRQKEPELVSLTPEGKVNWRSPAPPYVLSMPVFLPPDQVYLSTSEDVGGELLRIGSENGQPKVERGWENRLMRNHVHAAVPVGDYLYGFDNATLKAISMATGEQAWAHRGFGKGSVISADGLLFVLSDNGLLTLVEARPDAYQEKGQFQALTGRTWTALSVAGTRLFLRDQDELLCLEIGPGVDGLQEAETAANSPQ